MRTVTFADLQLAEYLRIHFVLVWHNQSPELYSMPGEQERLTAEQHKAYPQGGGGGNIRTYFCSANGQIVTYLEGFWRIGRFRAEAQVANNIISDLRNASTTSTAEQRAKSLKDRLQTRR